MSAKTELCAKCIGSGELVDRKGRVKVCTLCGGIGETEIINNSAYVNEHLYDE
jgi:DnaJ-class molecular chaperone